MAHVFASMLGTYLTKYLEVATNGNVACYGTSGYDGSFVSFKCKVCKDNLQQAYNTFNEGQTLPSEFEAWAKKHLHPAKPQSYQLFGYDKLGDASKTATGIAELQAQYYDKKLIEQLKYQNPFFHNPEGEVPNAPGKVVTTFGNQGVATKQCHKCENKVIAGKFCPACGHEHGQPVKPPEPKVEQVPDQRGRKFRE